MFKFYQFRFEFTYFDFDLLSFDVVIKFLILLFLVRVRYYLMLWPQAWKVYYTNIWNVYCSCKIALRKKIA